MLFLVLGVFEMSFIPEAVEYHIPWVSTTLLMSGITWGIIGTVSVTASRKIVRVPRGIQNFVEFLLETIYSLADKVIGEKASNYYPLLVGIFLYIFLGNLIGLVPGFSSPTADINTTASLAIVIFIYYNAQGIREKGVINYFKHFMGPPLAWYLSPINGLIFIIEIIGHFARPLSLAVRLFGNIFAKEVLLAILALLIVTFMGLPSLSLRYSLTIVPLLLRPLIILLGVLVSMIQAFVFLILSVIYVAGAVQQEEHH